MPEERNNDTKKVKGYDDGLQEKLPSVYEMLHHQNRMKTRYDFRDNSVEFQAGDLVWLYNPQKGMLVGRSFQQTGKVLILS